MRFFVGVSLLGVMAALAMATPVAAQGYEGLFSDGGKASPSAPTRTAPATPGYQGLIPGAAPAAPAATTSAAPAVVAPVTGGAVPATAAVSGPRPGITYIPQNQLSPVRSSEDLVRLARSYSMPDATLTMSDDLASRFRLPASATELLKQPRPRINGMLPMENSIKNSVDGAMSSLRAANLSADERARRFSQTVDSLKAIRQGLATKATISDRTYQAMGMPPLYVQEEREALRKSISHVDAALAQLQR